MNDWVIVIGPNGYQLLKVIGYVPDNFVCHGPQDQALIDILIEEQELADQTTITAYVQANT